MQSAHILHLCWPLRQLFFGNESQSLSGSDTTHETETSAPAPSVHSPSTPNNDPCEPKTPEMAVSVHAVERGPGEKPMAKAATNKKQEARHFYQQRA